MPPLPEAPQPYLAIVRGPIVSQGWQDRDKVQHRDDVDMVPGQTAAQRRIVQHSNKVFPAFASLDIMSVEAAQEYLDTPLSFLRTKHTIDEDEHLGRLFGVMLGFAITCVEADRENRVERSAES